MEVKLTKVENGFILQVTKWDVLTKQPDSKITVHETLKEALEHIEKAK